MSNHLNAPDRILMTADTVGGVWTYAVELAEALQPYGVNVALATMGAPLSDDQQEGAARLDNVEVYESDYRLEWMDEPWDEVEAAGEWLLDLEARVEPDLIHLNSYAHGALPWQQPVLVVGHSCVLSWFAAVKGEAPTDGWQQYRQSVTRGLRQADRVTAPTGAMLDALREHYGSFASDGPVYNGRKAEDFPPQSEEGYILSAGRLWDEAKNAHALHQAAASVSWPVYMAGARQSPDGEQVRLDEVELLGELATDTLADCMGRAAVFALPARYEPFGLTVLEAGLAGCALVLGDIPSLQEVWGDAALYVPPDDHAVLATALQRLIDDQGLRRRMAQRAREQALTYTPQRMARGYLDYYDVLLRERTTATVARPE